MEATELRKQVDSLIVEKRHQEAAATLAQLWRVDGSSATANFIVSRIESLDVELKPFKVAILRSYTVEPIVPLLRAAAFSSGINLTVELGEFNAYMQEILDGAPGTAEVVNLVNRVDGLIASAEELARPADQAR